MKFTHVLFVVIIAAVVSIGVIKLTPSTTQTEAKETAYERVLRTGTLRCGYAVATPWFFIDAKTGAKTGVGYDVTNAIAEKIGVKVEWMEETGWGVAEQGLIAGRYDALCASVCIDAHRVRAASYAMPYVHLPILAIVRDDDKRFDAGLNSINKPGIRVGVKNNHVFEYAAKERFPSAERVYLNDISDDTEFLTMLATNKIDIAFTGQSTLDIYNKNNTQKLRALPEPARFCHGGFMIPSGDYRLKELIDAATLQTVTGGQLANIVEKYMPLNPLYVRLPALPYQ